jgi:hypothetical protein
MLQPLNRGYGRTADLPQLGLRDHLFSAIREKLTIKEKWRDRRLGEVVWSMTAPVKRRTIVAC